MDQGLKRAFMDCYLRYEISFAGFTTANSTGAAEAEQQTRYREYADAQQAFLQAAHHFARSLLDQQEVEAVAASVPEPAPEPKREQLTEKVNRRFFGLVRSG